MDYKFELIPSKYFLKQIKKFSDSEKKNIEKKLNLLKENSFRFKSLSGYKHLFEIKIDISNQYSRLIYAVFYPNDRSVRVFGIFDRGNDFKDFYKAFKFELKNLKK